MPKIIFMDKRITLEVEEGMSILDADLGHEVPLYHTCGGNASCSTCRVRVVRGAENLSPVETAERQVLDAFDLAPPHRLGCQARALTGCVEIEIPARAKAPRPNKTPPVPKLKQGLGY